MITKFNGIPHDEIHSLLEKKMISTNTFMLTVLWYVNGFQVVEFLLDKERFNSEYFITVILEKLKNNSFI